MRVRYWRRRAVPILVLLCVSTVQAGGLIPPSASPDVALVFTGDVIGFLDPCG